MTGPELEHDAQREPRWGRGVRYALAAPLAVQGLRFGTKLALAFFLSPEEFGALGLSGLVVFALSLVCILGLDETLVAAPRLAAGVWRRMRRWHQIAGGAGAALCAALGLWLCAGEPLLGTLLLALAPMVWVANRSVLPMALLARERRYRELLSLEVRATLALSAGTLALAALGAGVWSLVIGLHLNALVMALGAERCARPIAARLGAEGEEGEEEAREAARTGARLSGSALLTYASERVDSLLVGVALGPLALGFYELAQQLATAAMGLVQSLTDRLLLPSLAHERRTTSSGAALLEALAVVIAFLLPLHVALALVGGELIELLYASAWAPAAALLPWLALASGLRCVELPALTALKAAGKSSAVLRLAGVRLALVAGAAWLALPRGIEALAAAVFGVRALSTLLALALARAALGGGSRADAAALRGALGALLAWLAGIALLWPRIFAPRAERHLFAFGLELLLLCLCWILARALFERRRVASEWSALRLRASALLGWRSA